MPAARPTLGSALRAARATTSGATPTPTGSSSPARSQRSGTPSSHESQDNDPIVRMSTLVKKPLPAARAPTAEEFYKDESVWVSTPVRASTAHGYSERLDYASHYSEELCRLLRTYGYKAASGLSLDGEDAETDFTVLLANLAHVLSPISHFEFDKLLDLDHEFDEYHMALNELIFVILPTVLRGTALALQEESSRIYPHDGRAALQRLRFHVEGIGDPDSNRYWTKLRALIIDESNDPAPQLTVFRKLADKHAKLHPAYSDVNRVEDLRHVLKMSAAVSPHVTPLYLVVLRELIAGARFSFSSLSLRICTVHRDEGRLARLTTPPPPTSGGGNGGRTPAGGGRGGVGTFMALRSDAYVEPKGTWKAKGGRHLQWEGAGFPCVTCFRLWGLTDGHPSTKGVCPYACRQSFAPDRIPHAAKPAHDRPPISRWPTPPDPPPPVRAMALQAPQDPAPDSATDVAIMGFRAADPPAER
ncbi:hypothetical protein CYMTET_56494 [Cymbomonas tetramitiformis]|uniref:Uncharacterized protein n=1 Tax=Cymbomonas tetramitiformis TaxID=36881 RepID=A0AAE0ELS4_9CHLO|nr:hypothetical protein CYMTET_56494 [Cymbomonas tetramitiformis]